MPGGDDDEANAKRMRESGEEALQRGNAEAARALLAESYRLRPNPETARLLEAARRAHNRAAQKDGDGGRGWNAARFIAPEYRRPLGILLGLIIVALGARLYTGAPLLSPYTKHIHHIHNYILFT